MLNTQEIANLLTALRRAIAEGAKELEFEPSTHTYTYRGRVLPAVSEVCQRFERGFDAEYWAKRKGAEAGVSAEVMRERWRKNSERACEEGTNIHSYSEWRFHNYTGLPSSDEAVLAIAEGVRTGSLERDERMDAVDEFWQMLANAATAEGTRLYPVASENRIVNPELGYAGTFDLLCLRVDASGNPGLVIFDYKTNGNLLNVFRQRGCSLDTMREPVKHLAACNAANYSCQLNLYQLGLERVVDMPVVGRVLVWLDPIGIAAIDANSQRGYSEAHTRQERARGKSKWRYSIYYTSDIASLKHLYGFTRRGRYALLQLPDLRERLHSFLSR